MERNASPDPYVLVFGVESMDERLFPPIAREAEAREVPLRDPERFLFLTSVGRLLQAIAADPDADPDADLGAGARREALRQHGRLLFHAFHFWHAGRETRSVDEPTLRRLLDSPSPAGDWRLNAPAPAGYLRLPTNLVWAEPAPGLRPEPAHGFFWMLDPEAEGVGALHVLLALGVRPDRPGLSVLGATGLLDDEPHWADADARPGGQDFASTLPGGDLDRLYSITTAAELLKLASLCFRELDPAGG